jgi:hypothetical protein
MAADDLTCGENQTLRWRILGHIRGPLDDMETFEMHPHRMSCVGQSPVSESVRCEQIAEFVG